MTEVGLRAPFHHYRDPAFRMEGARARMPSLLACTYDQQRT